jgi:hypothetical protein
VPQGSSNTVPSPLLCASSERLRSAARHARSGRRAGAAVHAHGTPPLARGSEARASNASRLPRFAMFTCGADSDRPEQITPRQALPLSGVAVRCYAGTRVRGSSNVRRLGVDARPIREELGPVWGLGLSRAGLRMHAVWAGQPDLLGLPNAPERSRTSTGLAAHKALNLVRLISSAAAPRMDGPC